MQLASFNSALNKLEVTIFMELSVVFAVSVALATVTFC